MPHKKVNYENRNNRILLKQRKEKYLLKQNSRIAKIRQKYHNHTTYRIDAKRKMITALKEKPHEETLGSDFAPRENIRRYPITDLIIRGLTIAGLIATVILLFFAFKYDLLNNMDNLERVVRDFGIGGPILFILLQFVQVVIPIIPGGITTVAGVILFGPFYGFLYNYIGICAGSIVNFFIARYYGPSFVRKVSSEKVYNKYESWMRKTEPTFTKMFAIAIVLPVAPDDFLCMLAGLTKMKAGTFIAIILLGKPFTIFAYSLGLTKALELINHLFH